MKQFLISALALVASFAFADSPFATQIVASTGLSGSGMYNDPNAALGKPTTQFIDYYGTGQATRAKLIEAPYWTDPAGNKTLVTINEGQSITMKFDHLVTNDPNNPYGLDFNVFGNSFFAGDGSTVGDSSNLNTFRIGGGSFDEPMKVSVSLDGNTWFTYDNGPYADALWPTNAYKWDRTTASWTNQEMDFTKPMDPSLTRASIAGKSAADVLDLYNGSAGGVGFDIGVFGLSAIQYVRVTGVSGFAGGEIDGIADVAPLPTPEPASFAALGLGVLALVHRRKGGRA